MCLKCSRGVNDGLTRRSVREKSGAIVELLHEMTSAAYNRPRDRDVETLRLDDKASMRRAITSNCLLGGMPTPGRPFSLGFTALRFVKASDLLKAGVRVGKRYSAQSARVSWEIIERSRASGSFRRGSDFRALKTRRGSYGTLVAAEGSRGDGLRCLSSILPRASALAPQQREQQRRWESSHTRLEQERPKH